jgi:hypothetical protein
MLESHLGLDDLLTSVLDPQGAPPLPLRTRSLHRIETHLELKVDLPVLHTKGHAAPEPALLRLPVLREANVLVCVLAVSLSGLTL